MDVFNYAFYFICKKSLYRNSHSAPWEEEGHECKNNTPGMFAIKVLKEAGKLNF